MKTNNYLEHHGIKGQKWGVKNGPPYPIHNARNQQLKRMRYANKTKKDVDKIFNSLTPAQKQMMDADPKDKEYLTIQQGKWVIKRFIAKYGDKPVGFFDFLGDYSGPNGTLNLSTTIAVNPKYQGMGIGSKLAKRGEKWASKNIDKFNSVEWYAFQSNAASKKLAEKAGFRYNPKKSDKEWAIYNFMSDEDWEEYLKS